MATTEVTIRRLTPANISALVYLGNRDDVHLGSTTATFDMTIYQAISLVEQLQTDLGAKHGQAGHPYKSLHAVVRKLYREFGPVT